MNFRIYGYVVALILVFSTAANAENRLTVYAVNYPLAYFAQRIGGDHVDVVFPVPADVDPAFWQPDAKSIAAYQQADMIVLNGAGYAKWVKRVSLPLRKLINTSAAFEQNAIKTDQGIIHQHGPGGEHSHAGTAFTTWLDFSQAVEQARAIKRALEKKQPNRAAAFTHNFRLVEQELVDLDKRLKAIVSAQPDRPFVASHPVYQYLARRYSINIKSVMWEPEVVPSEYEWQALRVLHNTHQAEWMIWEAKPDNQTVRRLQELGLESLVFDPCANAPDDGDFMSIMESNIVNLEKAY